MLKLKRMSKISVSNNSHQIWLYINIYIQIFLEDKNDDDVQKNEQNQCLQ